MRHKVKQAGLERRVIVDSAGTADYHIGDKPHRGTRQKLTEYDISFDSILGRQLSADDLDDFDYIIAMDESNFRDISSLASLENQHKIHMLSDYVPGKQWACGRAVPDPWFTGDFQQTYELVEQGCEGLLQELL